MSEASYTEVNSKIGFLPRLEIIEMAKLSKASSRKHDLQDTPD